MVKESLRNLLENGEMEIKGQFRYGSNYTFLVSLSLEGEAIAAVYKPRQGEQTLWDFPEASLAGREVAAYLLSEALGFHFVPMTILRDGPFGPGSLQEFIQHDPEKHYFTFESADLQRLRPTALFDLLVNNADRKGGHILLEKDTSEIRLIDHGLCFHVEDKLRTVIWDFANEQIATDLITTLELLQRDLQSGLAAQLSEYLEPDEITALQTRLAGILAHPFFPEPGGDRRWFPYPPV